MTKTTYRSTSLTPKWVLGCTTLALAGLVGACTGAQRVPDNIGDCPGVGEGQGAESYRTAMACYTALPPEQAAVGCRAALVQASSLPTDVLSDAVSCVLNAGEREDGVVVAQAFETVRTSSDRVIAVANGMPANFDRGTHGTTFVATISGAAQMAIGDQLENFDEGAKTLLVSLALAYTLDPLASYCQDYVRDLDENDPALAAYAGGIDTSGSLSETDRWALAASGEWDVLDVLDCYDQDQEGCSNWSGESPLEVLQHVDSAPDLRGPSQAIELLRSGTLSDEELRSVATFLTSANFSNVVQYTNAIMNDMTDPRRSDQIRRAIASVANDRMCDFGLVQEYLRRSTETDDINDPGSVWLHFLNTCLESRWDMDDMARAMAAGSWLNAPASFHEQISAAVTTHLDGQDCNAYVTLANTAYSIHERVWPAGAGYAAIASLADESCASSFESTMHDIAGDPTGHPESRLAAVEWFVARGDNSECRQIRDAMSWYNEDLSMGPGPWAEALADDLRSRCD